MIENHQPENPPTEESTSPLLKLIDRAGLNQKQVADALGVSSQTVNNWVRGRYKKEPTKLSIRQVKILCQVLHCELDELPDDFGPLANPSSPASTVDR
jgi:transcriptional regulator with XRE-family HTH domain